jgi:hypothetical protein
MVEKEREEKLSAGSPDKQGHIRSTGDHNIA